MIVAVCEGRHTVGADQFVYFDAGNAKRVLAPDAFVTLGVPDHDFDSYLVWEEGTPDVAFELLSPSDTPERWTFKQKLRRYQALGVRELVVFNVDAKPGKRLRVWDRIQQDFVERLVVGEKTPCVTLDLTMKIGPIYEYPAMLRLARDARGEDLVLAAEERVAACAAERDAYAAERDTYAAERDAYAARVAELEKQVASRKRKRS
jgi:hypothetical protein